MICFPNAKINLGLHVINKREDGFHNIETIFYPVNCCDMLEVVEDKSLQGGKATFLSEGLAIDGDVNDNLIVKAYQLMDLAFNLPAVRFFLYKSIPMGAGLGGGSSDAAFALKLLNDKFELGLSLDRLKDYASQLGSDCAFFIDNSPAYAFGRGHELNPVELDLSDYFIVLIAPRVHSSTAMAYKNVMKRGEVDKATSLLKLIHLPVKEWKSVIANDFEKTVFEAIPELPLLKQELYKQGALYACMSGSGSSLFGIFDHRPQLSGELSKLICYSGKLGLTK